MEKLENPKNKRQSTIEKESVEFSAEVADMWSATMDDKDITSTTCDDFDEKFDIDENDMHPAATVAPDPARLRVARGRREWA